MVWRTKILSGGGAQLKKIILILFLLPLIGVSVFADTVVYKSGGEIECEVLQQNTDNVIVRCKLNGDWVTKTIPRASIQTTHLTKGDQSDGKGVIPKNPPSDATAKSESKKSTANSSGESASKTKTPELQSPSDLKPWIRKSLGSAKSGEVIILALRGEFTEDRADSIGETISPGAMKAMVECALERSPALIVLEIDSPGGSVQVMDNVIEQTVVLQVEKKMRVVAWPKQAGSAASILSLACKEIVVHPLTRMGAATMIYGSGDKYGERVEGPKNALDQKLQSWSDASKRQILELTGRDATIQEAMQFPEKQLWYSKTSGFSNTVPPNNLGSEWMHLDNSIEKPMVLTSRQMMDINLARGSANDEVELLALLKLAPTSKVIRIDLLDPAIAPAIEELQKYYSNIDEEFYKLDSQFRNKLTKLYDQIELARRVAQVVVSTDQITEKQLKELQVQITNCITAMPTLSVRQIELLSIKDSSLKICYEVSLRFAKNSLIQAKNTLQTGMKLRTISINDIATDIDLAQQDVHNARIGCPPESKK